MKNTVDPDSCDSIFHKPRGNPRPKDCLKRALELIDYEACLKEQEATRNIDIVSRRSQSICWDIVVRAMPRPAVRDSHVKS